MANFEIAVNKTLGSEGGYNDNQQDSGGKTLWGISQRSYPEEDILNLTLDRAKFLYQHDYWNQIKGDQIMSQEVADTIFDFAVNGGVKTASKLAQEVVGVLADGIIGKQTIYALNVYSTDLFCARFALKKIERYVEIVDKNPSQIRFLKGWIKRSLK